MKLADSSFTTGKGGQNVGENRVFFAGSLGNLYRHCAFSKVFSADFSAKKS